MKIGKDEIGVFGGVGLVVLTIGVFLAVYSFLTFEQLGLTIVGLAMPLAGCMVYYTDLFDHRKKRQQAVGA